MAPTKSPELMHLYNLPQHINGGMPVHGLKMDDGSVVTFLFHNLDGIYSNCTIEGTDTPLQLSATMPIIYDYETGQYSVGEEEK